MEHALNKSGISIAPPQRTRAATSTIPAAPMRPRTARIHRNENDENANKNENESKDENKYENQDEDEDENENENGNKSENENKSESENESANNNNNNNNNNNANEIKNEIKNKNANEIENANEIANELEITNEVEITNNIQFANKIKIANNIQFAHEIKIANICEYEDEDDASSPGISGLHTPVTTIHPSMLDNISGNVSIPLDRNSIFTHYLDVAPRNPKRGRPMSLTNFRTKIHRRSTSHSAVMSRELSPEDSSAVPNIKFST